MRLLVSVRGPDEVPAALEGGADIIDAKDPDHGALGAVTAAALRLIDGRVPARVALSVALGDAASADSVARLVRTLPVRPRREIYVKIGLGRAVGERHLTDVIRAAADAAAAHPAAPGLIAVVYADSDPEGAHAREVRAAAARVGARGILIDTLAKDGRTLLDVWSEPTLGEWLGTLRAGGLVAALAGSLGVPELARLALLGPDIAGVRGAACPDGRRGTVDTGRVKALRDACQAGRRPPLANDHTGAWRPGELASRN